MATRSRARKPRGPDAPHKPRKVKRDPRWRPKRPGKRPTKDLRHRSCLALKDWLKRRPAIAAAINWESATGNTAYPDWTSQQKEQLCFAYWRLQEGIPLGLADPAPNTLTLQDTDPPVTVLAESDAWPLYLAHVANSILVERRHSVSWSIEDYQDSYLQRLLDSRSYFARSSEYGGYRLWGQGWAMPTPPTATYEFMKANSLIADDRLGTIANVLDWCHDELVHFSGIFNTGNLDDQWQFRGYPPLSRILSGTPMSSNPASGIRHRTAGCHGTNGLLIALLRTVNIPVDYLTVQGMDSFGNLVWHSTPGFPAESRYLAHGDDPYHQYTRCTPPYSAGELLIDQATYAAWFGPDVAPDARFGNLDRAVMELAIEHLPNELLRLYCVDLVYGHANADSFVYAKFSKWYSVADLEALALWTRLAAKVAGFGGCASIP